MPPADLCWPRWPRWPRRRPAAVRAATAAFALLSTACATLGPAPGVREGRGERDDPEAEDLGSVRRITVLIGGRHLEDDAWEPVESQVLFGLNWAEAVSGLPLLLEGGLHYSSDVAGLNDPVAGSIDLRGRTWDFSAGLLAEAPLRGLRLVPYVGAGGTVLVADLETDDDPPTLDGRDTTLAAYAKAGLLFEISEGAYVGFEARLLRGADVRLDGVDAEIDHLQVALVLGASY